MQEPVLFITVIQSTVNNIWTSLSHITNEDELSSMLMELSTTLVSVYGTFVNFNLTPTPPGSEGQWKTSDPNALIKFNNARLIACNQMLIFINSPNPDNMNKMLGDLLNLSTSAEMFLPSVPPIQQTVNNINYVMSQAMHNNQNIFHGDAKNIKLNNENASHKRSITNVSISILVFVIFGGGILYFFFR